MRTKNNHSGHTDKSENKDDIRRQKFICIQIMNVWCTDTQFALCYLIAFTQFWLMFFDSTIECVTQLANVVTSFVEHFSEDGWKWQKRNVAALLGYDGE